jgi:lysophospholipase L1-like esterase
MMAACGGGDSKGPTTPSEDPPSVSCPVSLSVTSLFATPMQVVYGSPTLVGGTRPVNMSCSPESGATFPIGDTTVTCTATDAKQRVSTCTLVVSVVARAPISLTRFVAFGDSITWGEDGISVLAGFDRLPLAPMQLITANYPFVLRTSLQARYPVQAGSIVVTNDGNRGELASDSTMPPRFSREVLGQGYQAVLIMEGSNDVNLAVGDSVVRTNALANLRTIVRSARNAGLRTYLATIPPMVKRPGGRGVGADLVPGFNDSVRSIASSEGVTLVDVYEAFGGDSSLLGADGLHPNASGYQRIADRFLQTLVDTLEQK